MVTVRDHISWHEHTASLSNQQKIEYPSKQNAAQFEYHRNKLELWVLEAKVLLNVVRTNLISD